MAILGRKGSHRDNSLGPMVDFLLDSGVNVNSAPSEEYTSALQAAIQNYNIPFADRLLDAGADATAHDPRFGTALSAAAFWGNVELMKKLVSRGADYKLGGQKYGLVHHIRVPHCHLRCGQ